jgi:hypothetical protein
VTATIMAATASGATYVMSIESDGVRWFRVPPHGSLAAAAAGWQASLPRVVPGERLLLGPFRSTPILDVAFLPGPSSGSPEWASGTAPGPPARARAARPGATGHAGPPEIAATSTLAGTVPGPARALVGRAELER